MGMSFANLHLLKQEHFTAKMLCDSITQEMQEKQYTLTPDRENADVTAVIYASPKSKWLTLSLSTWQQQAVDWQRLSALYSDSLHTTVLAAACFDSDYLLMHLRNTENNIDGWFNAGKPERGIVCRRTSLAPFRNVVSDFDAFKTAVKQESACAEEHLLAAAEYLGLDAAQCTIDAEFPDSTNQTEQTILYFSAPQTEITAPPHLILSGSIPSIDAFGSEMQLTFYNMGGKSKGIGIMFDVVEDEAVTYSNVRVAVQNKPFAWGDMQYFPITLEQYTLKSGKKVYYGECKDFIIPQYNHKVRWMALYFTPQGNRRKVLDIKVTIKALQAPRTISWYFWNIANSKTEYIKEMNKLPWMHLNPDDFDLD